MKSFRSGMHHLLSFAEAIIAKSQLCQWLLAVSSLLSNSCQLHPGTGLIFKEMCKEPLRNILCDVLGTTSDSHGCALLSTSSGGACCNWVLRIRSGVVIKLELDTPELLKLASLALSRLFSENEIVENRCDLRDGIFDQKPQSKPFKKCYRYVGKRR